MARVPTTTNFAAAAAPVTPGSLDMGNALANMAGWQAQRYYEEMQRGNTGYSGDGVFVGALVGNSFSSDETTFSDSKKTWAAV